MPCSPLYILSLIFAILVISCVSRPYGGLSKVPGPHSLAHHQDCEQPSGDNKKRSHSIRRQTQCTWGKFLPPCSHVGAPIFNRSLIHRFHYIRLLGGGTLAFVVAPIRSRYHASRFHRYLDRWKLETGIHRQHRGGRPQGSSRPPFHLPFTRGASTRRRSVPPFPPSATTVPQYFILCPICQVI